MTFLKNAPQLKHTPAFLGARLILYLFFKKQHRITKRDNPGHQPKFLPD
jgi:hypothetical protein